MSSSPTSILSNNFNNNNNNNTGTNSNSNGLHQALSSSIGNQQYQVPIQDQPQQQQHMTNLNKQAVCQQTSSNPNNLTAFITNYPSFMAAAAQLSTSKNLASADQSSTSLNRPLLNSTQSIEPNPDVKSIQRAALATE